MRCSTCNNEVKSNHKYCQKCGKPINDKSKKNKEAIIIVSIVYSMFIIFIVIGMIYTKLAINIVKTERGKLNDYFEDDEVFTKSIIKVKNMKLKYIDMYWKLDEVNSNETRKILLWNDYKIKLEYKELENEMTTDELLNKIKKEYNK